MSKNEEEAVEKAPEQTEEGDSKRRMSCICGKQKVRCDFSIFPSSARSWLVAHASLNVDTPNRLNKRAELSKGQDSFHPGQITLTAGSGKFHMEVIDKAVKMLTQLIAPGMPKAHMSVTDKVTM